MRISPTQRTLKLLKQNGCIPGIVERFNRFAGPHGIRQDLFQFIDIISLSAIGIVGVQSCGSSFSEHKKKILANPIAAKWIKFAGIELISWRKVKKVRGGKQKVWKPRIYVFTENDFK